jgi:dTDP-4-dehydrorhamnose reductase
MRILITGAGGLLGHGLARVFVERHEVICHTRADADITDAHAVRAFFAARRPEVVIHAAAIPDLDMCEENPDLARRVNVEGTRNVVAGAREVGAAVAYISTDTVFDGAKTTPYTEADAVNPPTVYGRTKVEAERIVTACTPHWIVRVPILFGSRPPGDRRPDFIEKGLRRVAAGKEYVVASDQLGSALYTIDAARAIDQLVGAKAFGLYHLSNQGACTRYDLARRAAELAGLDVRLVVGKPRAEMHRPAKRLRYAVMSLEGLARAGIAPPRPWQAALEEFIRSLNLAESASP